MHTEDEATAVSVSRGRQQITEIIHIAPVREGIVPVDDRSEVAGPITYADRLKIILETFNKREDQGFPSVMRANRETHFASWTLIDDDTRLVLHVVFAGDAEGYLRALSFEAPAYLHLIWSNCKGWSPVDADPRGLYEFIKTYQVRTSFLYADHPQLTVRDVDWLLALRAAAESMLPDDMRARLFAHAAKALTPKPIDEERARLLRRYADKSPAGAIERARDAYHAVIGRLYRAADAQRAEQEVFGRSDVAIL